MTTIKLNEADNRWSFLDSQIKQYLKEKQEKVKQIGNSWEFVEQIYPLYKKIDNNNYKRTDFISDIKPIFILKQSPEFIKFYSEASGPNNDDSGKDIIPIFILKNKERI
ncbi:hypothetical protein RB653_008569 [Dictyostelium firmibasis]|uniref:Uncharacterized protein n=1 Tax=Dictyostelium firmibasis TaxID=79012 RepID=A0AAN7TSZ1_9MYCE